MPLTDSQKDTVFGVSFIVGIVFMVSFGLFYLFGRQSGLQNGYRDAYTLQKENKLDDFMKINHPDLWIKYNIDSKEQKEKKNE